MDLRATKEGTVLIDRFSYMHLSRQLELGLGSGAFVLLGRTGSGVNANIMLHKSSDDKKLVYYHGGHLHNLLAYQKFLVPPHFAWAASASSRTFVPGLAWKPRNEVALEYGLSALAHVLALRDSWLRILLPSG